jgi:hypothetical protein
MAVQMNSYHTASANVMNEGGGSRCLAWQDLVIAQEVFEIGYSKHSKAPKMSMITSAVMLCHAMRYACDARAWNGSP